MVPHKINIVPKKNTFNVKLFVNKNNKQISMALPKNKLTEFKGKIPKGLKLEIKKKLW